MCEFCFHSIISQNELPSLPSGAFQLAIKIYLKKCNGTFTKKQQTVLYTPVFFFRQTPPHFPPLDPGSISPWPSPSWSSSLPSAPSWPPTSTGWSSPISSTRSTPPPWSPRWRCWRWTGSGGLAFSNNNRISTTFKGKKLCFGRVSIFSNYF